MTTPSEPTPVVRLSAREAEELAFILNREEPFAVRFGFDEDRGQVTLNLAEARALLRWIAHYKRMLHPFDVTPKEGS